MNLILEHSEFVQFYTYLDPLFEGLPELASFTYVVSDLDCNSGDEKLAHSSTVIRGVDLRDIVKKEKVQFSWAVLSAFDHEPIVPRELPYADGNPEFWTGCPTPQLKEARFEIVCWDSSATLFIGISSSMAATLKRMYPDILDLDAENFKRASNIH